MTLVRKGIAFFLLPPPFFKIFLMYTWINIALFYHSYIIGGRLDVFDVSAHTPIDVALRACGSPIKKSDLENQIVEVHTWGKLVTSSLSPFSSLFTPF